MNALVPVQAALPAAYTVSEMERMARAFAGSKLFGVQNAEQALALCLVAQAEGRHPASAAQDYHIIQNRPSKKADAMLRDFLASGGKVEWHALDDTTADATFSHPQGGSVRITWDMARAQTAGLKTDMWKKYPRQMLRARVVSEGVRTVFPMATSFMYVPEEVAEFEDRGATVTTLPPSSEVQRARPPEQLDAATRAAPASDKPVDRTNDVVPAPEGEDPEDWKAWRKVVATKVSRAASADQVEAIQKAHGKGLIRCAKILPDTLSQMADFVDKKLAQLGAQAASPAASDEPQDAEYEPA
jgi:hypothetical protein